MLKRLPLPGPANKDINEFLANSGGVELLNGIIENNGSTLAIATRPGLVPHKTIPGKSGIDGMYYWAAKKKYVFVASGKIYATETLIDQPELISKDDNLFIGSCQFASTSNHLYISSLAGVMFYWDGIGDAVPVADPVAPKDVVSVATLNNRVVAAERNSNRVWYTLPIQVDNPSLPLEWAGFFDATRTTDEILSLMVVGSELIIMRSLGIEFWYDDGSTPFRPIVGSALDIGLASSRGVVNILGLVFFLGSDRRFYLMRDRQASDVSSQQIGSVIENIDAISDVVASSTQRFVIFTFIKENITWVLDAKINAWYQWTTLESGKHLCYLGRHTLKTPSGRWILGGYDNNTYFMFPGIFKDGDRVCQLRYRTPHYDLGTLMQKQSSRTLIKVAKSQVKTWFPEIIIPPATRCHEYSYTMPQVGKFTYQVSGLPAGFSFNSATNTITAEATDKEIGITNITVKTINDWGAGYTQILGFEILDFDPEITHQEG